jgi:hypothetical protein
MPLKISTGVQIQPPLIILYGDHGLGKTSWAASAPSPIFLRTEDGIGVLDVARFDDVATSYAKVLDQLKDLIKEDHPYKTVVLDSLDHLEPLVWKHTVTEENNAKIQKIEDFGYGKGYIAALDYWRQIIDALLYLRTIKKMAVILIAHCNAKEFHDPNSDSYGRWQIKLHKTASALLQEKADAVLFLTSETFTEKDADTERVRGVGSGKRLIYTEARPSYVAKNRFGLPHQLAFPDRTSGWGTFQAAMSAAIKSSTPAATAATK